MKKTLSLLLLPVLAFSLCSCAKAPMQETDTVRIASLKGPTSMGLVQLYSRADADELGYKVEYQLCGSADEITPLLASGQLDMAAIPANLAATLYNKQADITVAAINTLGVLYVLETGDSVHTVADLVGKTVYSTGKGTTPQYALEYLLLQNGLDPEKDLTVEYLSEATQVAAMLADPAADAVAVLPQPFVTSAMASNEALRMALSFAEEWRSASDGGELVTGVLAVNRTFAENNPQLVAQFLADYALSAAFTETDAEQAAQLIE
ncbi:MAG: ABC transporter substrate-binding protein, partial [Oscillospiraceae bacterium]|nr:ABC transporter substrate-binding protein [Oscillospiraceae bacterium]